MSNSLRGAFCASQGEDRCWGQQQPSWTRHPCVCYSWLWMWLGFSASGEGERQVKYLSMRAQVPFGAVDGEYATRRDFAVSDGCCW